MCIIIGDVHKFIGHCIIPLDPCILLLLYKNIFDKNKIKINCNLKRPNIPNRGEWRLIFVIETFKSLTINILGCSSYFFPDFISFTNSKLNLNCGTSGYNIRNLSGHFEMFYFKISMLSNYLSS